MRLGLSQRDLEHRAEVARPHLADDVEPRPRLEELRAERRERAEEERCLAVDDAGVEVRHRHGRSAHGCLRVHLGLVLGDDRRVGRLEELPTDREHPVARDLGDAGALQQLQRPAAGADEDELRADLAGCAAEGAAILHAPRAVGQALEATHLGVRAHVGAVLGEAVDELVGQRSEVDVGARGHPRRRERLALAALLHQQRRPLVDDARVLAVLDAGEQRLVLQRLVALLEVRDILLAAHEGHVRGGVDERRRSVEHAGLDERRPQLTALLELLVDRDRLGGVDRAVLALGHVVQLAERRVAGAGVVPGVRALQRDVAQSLEDGDLQVGLQLLQQRAERRTHDAAADQQNVDRPRGEIAVVRAGQGVGGRFGHQMILVPPESTPDRATAPPRKVPGFLPQRQSERMPRPAASARSRVVELRRSRRGWLRRAPRSARR